jgi:cytosine/creatinine deaminase
MNLKDELLKVGIDEAKRQATLGFKEGGIPIGSALVSNKDARLLGAGRNRRVQQSSSILHGEIDCLSNAGRLGADVLRESTLFTTLSPCSMCSGATLLFKIPRVVVLDNVNFVGDEKLLQSRGVQVDVVPDDEQIQLFRQWCSDHPSLWNEDIGE